jgi:hypothetical protein
VERFVYSATFVCGEQLTCCECSLVQAGVYATQISVHNFGIREVAVQKRFIPAVVAGAPVGREPGVAGVREEERIVLPPQTATMDDCCRVGGLLFGGVTSWPIPLTIGFVEISSSGPIAVSAIYTVSGPESLSVSIEVEQVLSRHR